MERLRLVSWEADKAISKDRDDVVVQRLQLTLRSSILVLRTCR